MDEMSKLLELASTGDELALKKLNLDKPVKVTLDKPYANVGIIRLTGEYEATMAMIAAADRLQLWTLAASCRNKVKYLQFIAEAFCKTTLANKPIPGDTVTDIMKDLLDEMDIRKQQREGEKEAAESSGEQQREGEKRVAESDGEQQREGEKKAADSDGETEMGKSSEKRGERSEGKEGQSASSVKDADKEMEVEYGEEPRGQENNCKEVEGKSQTLSSDGDVVEKLVEDKGEEARGKDKKKQTGTER